MIQGNVRDFFVQDIAQDPEITLDLSPKTPKAMGPKGQRAIGFQAEDCRAHPIQLSHMKMESEAQGEEVTRLRTHSCDKHPDLWTMGPALSQGCWASERTKDGDITLHLLFI